MGSQAPKLIEPWYSVEKISEHLGVSKETVYRWLDRKTIPAHRMGKLWKFKPSEVDQWVRRGEASEGTARSERHSLIEREEV